MASDGIPMTRAGYAARRWAAVLVAIAWVAASVAVAGDRPPKASGRARPPAKNAGPVANDKADEPPPCRHGHPSPSVPVAARRLGARSRPPVFDQMMTEMARNPATAFSIVMKGQEAEAIRGTTISAIEERRIGRAQRDAYLRSAAAKGFPIRRDERDTRYLRDLVGILAKRMKNRARYRDVEVTIVDSPIPDGQSFPGGFLVFTSALLNEPDEATVAAVVAHELAHLDRGHLNEYARREKFAESAFRPGPNGMVDPSTMMGRGMALGSLMMDPFRPEHEHEADCRAATWLYQEGYDPKALAEFFERMHRRNRDQPDAPWSMIARSHPYSLDRREQVLGRLGQLKQWKPETNLGRYAENLEERRTK